MLSQHIILKIVSGRTQLPTRSFKRGEAVPQFSVGSRGDWIVSGTGVASFHVLLIFDGEHVFAASVDPAAAPVYLQGAPIGNGWNLIAPATELRFGEASLIVAREASSAPAAGRSASPPRPPKPDHRESPLPPVTVRQAPSVKQPASIRQPASKQTGPGNTAFFDNLKAQVEAARIESAQTSAPPPAAASAPSPPALGADALMAGIAPTIARQPPVTFPMDPQSAAQPLAPTQLPLGGAPRSAVPPPLISAPDPLQAATPPPPPASAPPPGFVEAFPTAFSPQFPGDMPPAHLAPAQLPPSKPPPAHLLPANLAPGLPPANLPPLPPIGLPPANLPPGQLPPGQLPPANLPTIASQSSFSNQASAPGWSGGRVPDLPTHFAPAGSIALPPDVAPTAIAPTDDGAPLPLGMPFAVPPLPMPPNADGEVYSTMAAGDDAMRAFAANLPPNPPQPAFPGADAAYPPAYMQSQTPPPYLQSQVTPPPAADGMYMPTYMQNQTPPPMDAPYQSAYLDSQTPPPYAPPVRYSHNPRARPPGSKRLLIILIPMSVAIILVALVWYLGVIR